ncbi:diguanylate cyclase [Massilia sp. W12]|uniref:GGDEF domain-containing response regulator n=1 Tax=Massilia sp. W12 TaxID=3126507 RepID=UPI0030D081A4
MSLFDAARLPVTQSDASAPVAARRRILLIDDEDANLRAMQSVLQDEYEILCAHDGAQALALLQELPAQHPVAVIISDQRMPHCSGVEVLRQSQRITPHTIRIIVSGYSDLDAIIASINRAEVWKFISKPFDARQLQDTVRQAISLFEQSLQQISHYQDLQSQIQAQGEELTRKQEELEQARQRLAELDISDALTGLRNRRFLQQRIEADLSVTLRRHEEWLRRGKPGRLLDVDLVFFHLRLEGMQNLVQQYGAAAGDAVLQQMRQRLQQVFRESDYLMRWDDTEFLCLARATNRSDAGVLAERIRHAVSSQRFALQQGQSVSMSSAIGFAAWPFIEDLPRALSWEQTVQLAQQAGALALAHGENAWAGLYALENAGDAAILQALHEASALAHCGQLQLVYSIAASER